MPRIPTPLVLTTAAAVLLLAGCQGGASTPGVPVPANPAASPLALPVTPEPGWVDAGAFELAIDVATLDFTLAPLRHTSAIGDTFSELGLTPGFTRLFGKNFEVKSIRRGTGGTIEVETYIRHPFSPANRPDLAIFNLKCWVVTDRPGVSLDGHLTAPGTLANADGYGNMWQVTHDVSVPGFDAAPIQPYVILREDPSSAPFDWTTPAGFNVFFPGQDSADTLVLNPGTAGALNLRLYLTADYGQSAVRATRQSPEYELPKFAGNAPWKVEVTELANDLVPGNAASSAEYRVDIWDWKHGQGFSSDVASATLSIPGITSSAQTLALSGSGQDPDPLTATTLVLNGQSAGEGDYWGLVVVTDTATGTGLLENLSTPVPISQYRTFQVFPVEILFAGDPPTAVVERVGCPGDVKVGVDALFDGSSSTPGTAPIVAYDWDFDYDGNIFDIDATGVLVNRPSTTPGTFTIALRVTDSNALSDIATTTLTVVALAPPAWQPAVRVTNNSGQEQFHNESPGQLATGADGTVHLVYIELVGSVRTVYYQRYGGCPAAWSATELVAPAASTALSPAFAETLDGKLHVIYPGVGTGTQLFYTVRAVGGGWSTPVQISVTPPGAGGTWSHIRLAVAPNGNLGVCAMRSPANTLAVCPGVPAEPLAVFFLEFDGTSWSAQQQVAAADLIYSISSCGNFTRRTESSDIVALANNDWLIAFETLDSPYISSPPPQVTHLGWVRRTAGVWGSIQHQYVDGQQGGEVQLARSPNGLIWALFRRTTANQIALVQYDGTNWSPTPINILTAATSSLWSPRLHFAADGQGVALVSNATGNFPLNMKRFSQDSTLAAIAAMPVESPEPPVVWERAYASAVQLGDGRTMACWRSGQWGTGALYEIEAAIWE